MLILLSDFISRLFVRKLFNLYNQSNYKALEDLQMSVETIAQNTTYLVNRQGRRTHAVLPIKDYEELLSDLEGIAVTISRRNEGSISIEEAKRRVGEKSKVSC